MPEAKTQLNADIDTIVIGAGVIGLAVARALSACGREVLVVERHAHPGSETSSRNSEVVHAGIYYPPGSAKARLCVEGKKLLYQFAADNGVSHANVGKLIVATSQQQVATLNEIKAKGERNGVNDLTLLTASDVKKIEPEIRCSAALLSPSTGLIDSHELIHALQGHAQAYNAMFAFNTTVRSIARRANGGFTLSCAGTQSSGAEDADKITCRSLVVAAGLYGSQLISTLTQSEPQNPYAPPKPYYAKGNYFMLSGKAPFNRLVYPVPGPGGLGVHLTLDLTGRARFGPDVQWLEGDDPATFNYDVDPERSKSFYAAIRNYWPDLPDDSLQADYCGIRPKVTKPGQPAGDFMIHDARNHGYPGLIATYGIESPGLTASLAIAKEIKTRLQT